MGLIERIAKDEHVQGALADFAEQVDEAVELAIAVQQIAAPTFAEGRRAAFAEACFRARGLQDVRQDAAHNVYGRLPGVSGSNNKAVVVSAHLDTVFPADTDLAVRRDGRLVYGPGMADNSTGVAGLVQLATTMKRRGLRPAADIWFVANVGEEGLGDLKGMRQVVDRFGEEAIYIVVEGGLYGYVTHQAIGVRRFRIEVKADGGHSWGSFGNSSAIHELGRIIAAIDELEVPADPKTTYNVGVVEGGTSINTIAQSANLLLDLRSADTRSLAALLADVEAIVQQADAKKRVSVTASLIGSRPAGEIPRNAPLVAWARDALRQVGCQSVEYLAGSTDANIPLGRGLPAVCVGLAQSGNTHRLDEYLDPTHLPDGLGQLLLLALAAAGYDGHLSPAT